MGPYFQIAHQSLIAKELLFLFGLILCYAK